MTLHTGQASSNSTTNRVRRFGGWLDDRPILSLFAYLLILAVVGGVLVGGGVVVLQATGIMPQPRTYTPVTLLGVTLLYGMVIGSSLVALYGWRILTGRDGAAHAGLTQAFTMGLWGFLIGVCVQSLIFGLGLVLNWQTAGGAQVADNVIVNTLIITISSINAGVVEEVIFRGVIYSSLRRISKPLAASVVSSILFAGMHFITNQYHTIVLPILVLTAAGMLFAWLLEATGSLWLPIGLHIAWDAVIGWLNMNALNGPHILTVSSNAPDWILGDGGVRDWVTLIVVVAMAFGYLRVRGRREPALSYP